MYTAAGQVGSRREGMGSSHGLDMSEAFVSFPSSSRQMAGPGLILTIITASYLMCTWGSSPSGKEAEAWNQLEPRLWMNGSIPPLPHLAFYSVKGQFQFTSWYFRLPQQCSWDLRSSAMLTRRRLIVFADVSRHVWPICCTETSVCKYQPSMRNITEWQRLQFMYHNMRRVCAWGLVVLPSINSPLCYRECLNCVPSGEVICTYGPQDICRSKEMFKEPQLLNYVTINTTGESRRGGGGGGLRELAPDCFLWSIHSAGTELGRTVTAIRWAKRSQMAYCVTYTYFTMAFFIVRMSHGFTEHTHTHTHTQL